MNSIRRPSHRLALLLGALLPAVAQAHPGHAVQGALSGLLHPLQGLDHLAAAIAVGAWAAQRGGALRMGLPLVFALALLAGVAGADLLPLEASAVEQGIAASVLVLGLLLASAWRLAAPLSLALVAGFALCHGLAHGGEQPANAALATYGVGLVTTTLGVAN